jgi:hypothetical protein
MIIGILIVYLNFTKQKKQKNENRINFNFSIFFSL